MLSNRSCMLVPAILSFSLASAGEAKAEVIIADGDFSPWSSFSLVLDDPTVAGSGPGTSSATASRVATGGNPGAFFQSVHTIVSGTAMSMAGSIRLVVAPVSSRRRRLDRPCGTGDLRLDVDRTLAGIEGGGHRTRAMFSGSEPR